MSENKTQPALPRKPLGRTGFQLSIVSVGGWLGQLYDPAKAEAGSFGAVSDDRAAREAAAESAVRRAISLGINYFDTAPMYSNGEAERLLGVGLRALAPAERQGLFVSSKVGAQPDRPKGYDQDTIRWSLERSLKKLYSDRLDIVYIHDPESDAHMDQMLGPGGAVEALEALKAQGVVGAIGLGVRIHRFLRRAIESGRFDAILPSYDYTPIRNSAGPLIDLAFQNNVGVVGASPYMAGLLAGIHPDQAAGKRKNDIADDLTRARALWRWADEHGVDLGAVAMQYHLRNPHITTTLVGPRDAGEVESNIRHATTPLPADIWVELEAFLVELGPYAPGGESK
jgi:D-threo-aldose 1-dehydrogenase